VEYASCERTDQGYVGHVSLESEIFNSYERNDQIPFFVASCQSKTRS
jgi:hypothetical protein